MSNNLKIFLSHLIACSSTYLCALELHITGSPSMTISQADLEAGAGSDFKESIQSQESLLQVNISPDNSASNWRLKLSAATQQLPNSARLYARINYPIGPGNNIDTIQSDWLLLSYSPQTIATGTSSNAAFEMQLRIDHLHLKDVHELEMNTRLNFELEQN